LAALQDRTEATSDVDAVLLSHIAHLIRGGNKGAEEEQIAKGDEKRVATGRFVAQKRDKRPPYRQSRDDKRHENVIGRKSIIARVLVHKVRENAHGRNERQQLHDAVECKDESGEHDGGVAGTFWSVWDFVWLCSYRNQADNVSGATLCLMRWFIVTKLLYADAY